MPQFQHVVAFLDQARHETPLRTFVAATHQMATHPRGQRRGSDWHENVIESGNPGPKPEKWESREKEVHGLGARLKEAHDCPLRQRVE